MKLKVYIIFPEEDNDFIRIGTNLDSYTEIIQEVSRIRAILKNKIDYEFWFDSKNMVNFSKKANVLVGGSYLSNISNQLRVFFGSSAKDIHDNKISVSEFTYVKLNSDFSVSDAFPILMEATESSIINESESIIVVNICNAFNCERETVNLIKDSSHINDLPELIRIPVFNNDYELKEWINSITTGSEFSLRNKDRFQTTGKVWIKQSIYIDKLTGHYWYFDYFHKDNELHFEVFDSFGNHLYEADQNGNKKPDSQSNKKKISHII